MTTVLVHSKKRGDCKGLTPAPRAAAPSASPPLLVSITSSCDGTCRIQNTPAASRLLFSFACVCCLGRLAGLVGLVGFGRASQSRAESVGQADRQFTCSLNHSVSSFPDTLHLVLKWQSKSPAICSKQQSGRGGEGQRPLHLILFFISLLLPLVLSSHKNLYPIRT
jgi:hypothetical protein